MLLLLYSRGTEAIPAFGNPHSPLFFPFFFLVCAYTLVQCHNPTDKKVAFPPWIRETSSVSQGAEKGSSSPKESGVGHSAGYQQASPHQQDEPWATSDILCRSLCYSSLVWINKSSSVSLHLTEKMKFEMKLPCWWQWKSKTGKPREMKMKSCKYSRCRPHFFQLMEFYHELATSKKHLRSCRHVNISFNFLQVNC